VLNTRSIVRPFPSFPFADERLITVSDIRVSPVSS
jgi:hypothetical protein